jgi:hypothetical protein
MTTGLLTIEKVSLNLTTGTSMSKQEYGDHRDLYTTSSILMYHQRQLGLCNPIRLTVQMMSLPPFGFNCVVLSCRVPTSPWSGYWRCRQTAKSARGIRLLIRRAIKWATTGVYLLSGYGAVFNETTRSVKATPLRCRRKVASCAYT